MDDLPVEQIREFEAGLYRYLDNAQPGVLEAVRAKKALDDEIRKSLTGAIQEFKARFVAEKETQKESQKESAQPAQVNA